MDKQPERTFFKIYRDAILFNRNLISAGAGGFIVSALISQLYYSQYDSGDFATSVMALATEYAVYIPLFALLFYVDNRHKYLDPATGKRDGMRIRQDIKKLFAAFSVSEVIFAVTRFLTQYELLLQARLEPYEASMASSLIAWAMFFVAINLMAKAVRLFKGT
jgi:hypothetical protein